MKTDPPSYILLEDELDRSDEFEVKSSEKIYDEVDRTDTIAEVTGPEG